jgi:hypothetical protein
MSCIAEAGDDLDAASLARAPLAAQGEAVAVALGHLGGEGSRRAARDARLHRLLKLRLLTRKSRSPATPGETMSYEPPSLAPLMITPDMAQRAQQQEQQEAAQAEAAVQAAAGAEAQAMETLKVRARAALRPPQ